MGGSGFPLERLHGIVRIVTLTTPQICSPQEHRRNPSEIRNFSYPPKQKALEYQGLLILRMVEAAGIEPALYSAKYLDLKGNFQEISAGIRLETVF